MIFYHHHQGHSKGIFEVFRNNFPSQQLSSSQGEIFFLSFSCNLKNDCAFISGEREMGRHFLGMYLCECGCLYTYLNMYK